MEITQSESRKEDKLKKKKMKVKYKIYGVTKGEERKKGIEHVLEEIMAENISNLKKEAYPGTRSTKCPKRDEPKQTHTKTYHH